MLFVIYSILCKTDTGLLYIGSTKDYDKRKNDHMFASQKNTKKIYELIRSNGGWDNFVMSPIKHFECATRLQAREEEDKYIVEMKATMNSIRAVMCPQRVKEYRAEYKKQNADHIHADAKRYYQEHKDERKVYRDSISEDQKEYKKKWYTEHKEGRHEKNKEEYTCACGRVGKITNRARHEKSQFHLDFITTAVVVEYPDA
jgi:hypothetical protein